MKDEELVNYIVKKSNKSNDEILEMANIKREQLSNMISEHGALVLVAQELNVKLKIVEGVVKMEEEDQMEVQEEEIVSVGTSNGTEEELTLDDLGKKYIKSPKVGDTVEFVLAKIKKSKDIDAVTKDGKKFKTNLTSVDYKMVYESTNGESFSVKNWECVGKINSICKKLNRIVGVELQIKHIKDGMKEKEGDSYSVKTKIDGKWVELDRKTNQFK